MCVSTHQVAFRTIPVPPAVASTSQAPSSTLLPGLGNRSVHSQQQYSRQTTSTSMMRCAMDSRMRALQTSYRVSRWRLWQTERSMVVSRWWRKGSKLSTPPQASASTSGADTTPSSSSAATSTPSAQPHGLRTGGKIGLGVGTPLGLIALAGFLAIVYVAQQRQATSRKLPPEVDGTSAHRELPTNANTSELPASLSYHELNAQPQPVELKATF